MRDGRFQDGGTRAAVGTRTHWRNVGFDDATASFAVHDAHHDGACLRATELRDHGYPQASHPESHRHQELVGALGGRGEHLEPGERVGVKPCAVPGIESVGDDVRGSHTPTSAGDGAIVPPVGVWRDHRPVQRRPRRLPRQGAPRPGCRRRGWAAASSRIRKPCRPASDRASGRSASRGAPCRWPDQRRGADNFGDPRSRRSCLIAPGDDFDSGDTRTERSPAGHLVRLAANAYQLPVGLAGIASARPR